MARRLPVVVVCVGVAVAFVAGVSSGEAGGQTQVQAQAAAPLQGQAQAVRQASESETGAGAEASSVVSLDRIRAGVQRKTFIAGERGEDAVPMFRTEVVGHTIKLRNYWSDRDPDTEPDPFMYPIPSAAELLINYGILKPRSALRARKQRLLKEQIRREVEQVERQRDADAPSATPASPAAPATPATPAPPSTPAPPR